MTLLPIPDNNALVEVIISDSANDTFDAPIHSHKYGQLVLPLIGSMVCEVENQIWMAPPETAVWIPPQQLHTNKALSKATFCFVYIHPDHVPLPNQSCTLSITPLVRELIVHIANLPTEQYDSPLYYKLCDLLFDMLPTLVHEQLNFPLTDDPLLRKVANTLLNNPADRRTVSEWAASLAMSEKTFTRLVKKQAGMTFGQWRRQLHIVLSLQFLSQGHSVQITSELLGYESVTAFITMFKKALGVSPKRYYAQR